MDCMNLIIDKHLALRPNGTYGREPAECLPSKLEPGSRHEFDKAGRRIIPLKRPVPLHLTHGNNQVKMFPPLAAVTIIEPTHYLTAGGEVRTRGTYKIEQLFDQTSLQSTLEFYELIRF